MNQWCSSRRAWDSCESALWGPGSPALVELLCRIQDMPPVERDQKEERDLSPMVRVNHKPPQEEPQPASPAVVHAEATPAFSNVPLPVVLRLQRGPMAPSGGDDQHVKQLHTEERRAELKRLLADRRLGQAQAKPRSGLTMAAALTPEQWRLVRSSPESASIPAVDSSQTEQTKQQPAVSSAVSEASAAAHPAGFALQANNEEVDTSDELRLPPRGINPATIAEDVARIQAEQATERLRQRAQGTEPTDADLTAQLGLDELDPTRRPILGLAGFVAANPEDPQGPQTLPLLLLRRELRGDYNFLPFAKHVDLDNLSRLLRRELLLEPPGALTPSQ